MDTVVDFRPWGLCCPWGPSLHPEVVTSNMPLPDGHLRFPAPGKESDIYKTPSSFL